MLKIQPLPLHAASNPVSTECCSRLTDSHEACQWPCLFQHPEVHDLEGAQPAIEFGDVGAYRDLAPRHGHLDGAA